MWVQGKTLERLGEGWEGVFALSRCGVQDGGASRGGSAGQLPLAVCCERQDCRDIIRLEVRKIRQDLVRGHAGSQVLEDVVDRVPEASNAGLSTRLPGLDRDALPVVHAEGSPPRGERVNWILVPHESLQRRVPGSDAHGNTGAEPGPGLWLNDSCGDEGAGYLIELLPMTIQWLLEITRHSVAFP